MTITFVGHGYVGLVTASIFADLGNIVWVIGRRLEKIESLKKSILPFYEPGLEKIVKRNIKAKRLLFTLDYKHSIPNSDVVFIAVGTPSNKTGDAELLGVFNVAEKIGKNLKKGYTIVATKSTVPIGTNKRIRQLINEVKPKKAEFDIASVPEFLREGTAIQDTLKPDRVVIGSESRRAYKILLDLHKPIDGKVILTNLETAEFIKYASNSFLATKISFANAIAKLSELSGADGLKVLEGIGLDKRIGNEFLAPGPGYGGSCLPKDVKALIAMAKDYDYNFALLDEVEKINGLAKRDIVKKAKKALGDLVGKTIGVLGLSFKPNTDDMRDAQSLEIIELLRQNRANVKVFDPQAMVVAKEILGDKVKFCKDAYEAARDADAVLIITDWNEFKKLDLKRLKKEMKSPIIIDGRNIYDPQKIRKLGFNYTGVGR